MAHVTYFAILKF